MVSFGTATRQAGRRSFRFSSRSSPVRQRQGQLPSGRSGPWGAEAASRCLARLARKLRAGEASPHEIGLFLSYPPRDVRGFICNGACRHKCAGCWKVYGNEAAALRTFEAWRRCTRILEARLAQGCPLEKLAVAG